MRHRVVAAAAVWALVAAACGGGGDDGASPTAGEQATTTAPAEDHEGHDDHSGEAAASCSPGGTTVSVVASGTRFDTDCLAAPAGKPFTLSYDNRDSLAHNIVILESHTATDVLFRADIFSGPKVSTFEVPALAAGTFAFHCEVHPTQMQGTFIVK